MATLPTAESFGARPTPRSQRGVTSARADIAQRAAAGAARQDAASAGELARIADAFAEKYAQEDAERQARDLTVELNNGVRLLERGDGTDANPGYLNLEGEHALGDAATRHDEALGKLGETVMGKASSRVQGIIGRAVDSTINTSRNRSVSHFGNQRTAANDASQAALLKSIADKAGEFGADENSKKVSEMAELAHSQVLHYSLQRGIPSAESMEKAEVARTGILIAEIERQAATSAASARQFFKDSKRDIDGDRYSAIEDMLKRAERAERVESDRKARLALADLNRDAKTALDYARSTGEGAGNVEQRLRDAGETETANDFARQLDANIEVHDTVEDLALANPAEINGWAEKHRPAEIKGARSDQAREFLTQQAIFQEVVKGVVANRKALDADPAGYVIRDPDVREALEAAQAAPNDPALAQRAALVSLDAQTRVGVPATDRRILTVSQARAQVVQIEDPETGARGQAQIINGLSDIYGPQFRTVYHDLVREGLPEGRQVLASLGDSPLAPILARAIDDGDKVLVAALGEDGSATAKGIKEDVRQALADYTTSVVNADKSGLGGSVPFTEGVIKGVTTLALALTARGDDIGTAVDRASESILSQYSFQDGYRVPVEFDRGQVAGMADRMLRNPRDLGIAPAISRETSDLSAKAVMEATLRGIQSNAFWVTNEDETGLVLLMDTNQGVEIVMTGAGERVEMKFEDAADYVPTPDTTFEISP